MGGLVDGWMDEKVYLLLLYYCYIFNLEFTLNTELGTSIF